MSHPKKWTTEFENILRENASMGLLTLFKLLPGFSQKGIKKKASFMGVSIKTPKEIKPDMKAKFEPGTHVIKNSSIVGKVAVWIPEERLTLYIRPEVDIQKAVDKIRNRKHDY